MNPARLVLLVVVAAVVALDVAALMRDARPRVALRGRSGALRRGVRCAAAARRPAWDEEDDDEEEEDSNQIVSELTRAVIAEDFESAAEIQARLNRRRAKAAAELDELAAGERWFEEVLPETSSWAQLGVPLWLKDRLTDLGMPFATPVQTSMLRATMRPVKAEGTETDGTEVEAIVFSKRQGDVALRAPTGSGKTVAFLAAALSVLSPELFLREQRIFNAIVGPELENDLDRWEQRAESAPPDAVPEASDDGAGPAGPPALEELEDTPLTSMTMAQIEYFGELFSKIRRRQGNIGFPELVNEDAFDQFDPDFIVEVWEDTFGSRSKMKDLDVEEFFELCLAFMNSPRGGTFGIDGSTSDILELGRRLDKEMREREEREKFEQVIDATLATERDRALEDAANTRVDRLFSPDAEIGGSLRERREQAARDVAFAYTPLLLMPELGSVVRSDLQQPAGTRRKPLLLVVCPSRELAAQVAIQLFKLVGGNMREEFAPGDRANMFKYRGPRGLRVLGLLDDDGVQDASHLDHVDFVVGVPEVLRTLTTELPDFFAQTRIMCIDEADLTMQQLAGTLRNTIIQRDPDVRSHFLVGASLNLDTMRIATRQAISYRPLLVTPHHFEEMELNTDTTTMALTTATIIDRANMVAAGMRHQIVIVARSQALLALAKLIRYHMDAWETTGNKGPRPRVVVFAQDDEEARDIAPGLRNSLWGVHKIHVLLPREGQMPLEVMQNFAIQNSRKKQEEKRRSLAERIRNIRRRDGPDAAKKAEKDEEERQKRTGVDGEFNVWAEDVMPTLLVTTPESARGLDFANITHVYSLHMPANVSQYAHQAGRLGRVGNLGPRGVMTSFVDVFQEKDLRALIKEAAGDAKVELVPPVLYEVEVEAQMDAKDALESTRKSLDDLYELFNADPSDLPATELRPAVVDEPGKSDDTWDGNEQPAYEDERPSFVDATEDPPLPLSSRGAASLSDRLEQLNFALQNGLITEKEYKEKKRKMLDEF